MGTSTVHSTRLLPDGTTLHNRLLAARPNLTTHAFSAIGLVRVARFSTCRMVPIRR